MLVFTRKRGERSVVVLPDGRLMVVTILEVDRNKVRIGWDGPKELEINREEVHLDKNGPLPEEFNREWSRAIPGGTGDVPGRFGRGGLVESPAVRMRKEIVV